MCATGHALIRTWSEGRWWLACVHCPYRLFEGKPSHPVPRKGTP